MFLMASNGAGMILDGPGMILDGAGTIDFCSGVGTKTAQLRTYQKYAISLITKITDFLLSGELRLRAQQIRILAKISNK